MHHYTDPKHYSQLIIATSWIMLSMFFAIACKSMFFHPIQNTNPGWTQGYTRTQSERLPEGIPERCGVAFGQSYPKTIAWHVIRRTWRSKCLSTTKRAVIRCYFCHWYAWRYVYPTRYQNTTQKLTRALRRRPSGKDCDWLIFRTMKTSYGDDVFPSYPSVTWSTPLTC